MTYLCVAIFVHDAAQARRDIAAAAEAGADMVELRLDTIDDPQLVKEIVSQSLLPCIVTCRPTWEGGRSTLSNQQRVDLLLSACVGKTRYVDLELQTFRDTKFSRPPDSRFILSVHDFAGRPDRLYNLVTELSELGGDVNKIVWTARSIRDNIEAFELLLNRDKPRIAFCMGEAGLISRVLARKFGAFLTFAGLTVDSGTAPGQLSVHDMKRLYRWDAIGPQTKVYGVVACPVAHSMSPAVHNAAFEHVGYDGVYLPMLVESGYESFKAFMESFIDFRPLDLSGLSVTIPHKENALRYLQEKGARIDTLAAEIGALNTIVIRRQADRLELQGLNTDYAAIIDTICAALDIKREELSQRRVAVIGAGGTARAATAALASLGATVVVYNRTRQRADLLAAEFNGRSGKVVSAPLDKLCDSCCDIYINATSVGMHPNVDQSPLIGKLPRWTSDTLVFDTVYNPPVTRLLRQAADAGARTVGGVEMFVRQAAAQFQAWTGMPAPVELMRQVIHQRLAGRQN